MTVYVLTVDRVGSRADPADAMSRRLEQFRVRWPGALRTWQLGAGDELQALFDRADTVLDPLLELGADPGWHVGLGVGAVRTPLPKTVHEATGEAFVLARDAVTAAKTAAAPAVRGGAWAEHVQALLVLNCSVRRRRTPAGRAACALADEGLSQSAIAERLSITQSSVSRRLSAALWHEERATRETLIALLRCTDGETAPPPDAEPEVPPAAPSNAQHTANPHSEREARS